MKFKKKILLSILFIVVIVFTNGVYYVFHGQLKSAEKLSRGKELSLYECCSIYTMHTAVWLFGWPLSPEAAKECALLHLPQKDTVYFEHFNLSSPKVNAALKALKNKPYGTSVRIAWEGTAEYALASPEHRAAIAVNPCVLTKVTKLDYQHFADEDLYELTSPMWYPKWSDTHFNLGPVTIRIQEGLFRYLQERNWLSHYIAVYKYTTPAI